MDALECLNVGTSLREIADKDPSAIGLIVAAMLVLLGTFHRAYQVQILAAFYPFEINKLSLSYLVSAIVALGVTADKAALGGQSGIGLHLNRWIAVLVCCFILGLFLYINGLEWLLRNDRRRQEHQIARALGWALYSFKELDTLKAEFHGLSDVSLRIEDGRQFTDRLRDDLLKFEDSRIAAGGKGTATDDVLARHLQEERQLQSGIGAWLTAALQLVPAYVLLCVALHVIRLTLAGRP